MKGEKILELKQERAGLTTSIRSLIDEFGDKEIPAEKREELGKMETRFDAINEQILVEERQLQRERIAGEKKEPAPGDQRTEREEEIRTTFRNYLITGNQDAYNEYRALQQDNPTQAGYLVAPEQFVAEIIQEINNSLFVRKLANVLPPLKGAKSLGYPKRTARMTRASWGTEIAAPTPDTALAFGKREFKPNPASAEILVSKTLIRNAPNAEQIVRNEISFMFGELMEIAYMTGDGAGKPLGMFTASPDGISTARDYSDGNTANSITFDGLIGAKYNIKDQYQAALQWIFHRDAVKQVAKIKDGDGQYIWQQSTQLDQPDRLLGKPINMSEYAPNTFTAGLYVGMLCDLKMMYWIVDGLGMEIQALTELYARTNQIDYLARIETDGMPVLEECCSRIKLGA
ncbi:MAG: phage major capsid protein [Carboxydocellales bacterium]